MKRRLFASLLTLVMILSLVPLSALATEDEAPDNGTSVVCIETADCQAEEHTETCPLYVAPVEDGDDSTAVPGEPEPPADLVPAGPTEDDPEDDPNQQIMPLAEEDTYILTLNYASGQYYDSSKIASVAVKSIGEESVSAANSYQVAEGTKVVIEVTYAENAGNAMAALAFENIDGNMAGLKTTQDEDGRNCKTFYFEMPAKDVDVVLYGLTDWSVEDNTITITGSGSMPDFDALGWGSSDLTTPGGSFTVYSPIYEEYHSTITSAIIGEGITRTGNYVFTNFKSLERITLPDSLTSVGWCLIRGCTKVSSVKLPERVTQIAGIAFSGASGLKTIQTGNASGTDGVFDVHNVTKVGISAFSGTPVKKIALADGVPGIGQQTFQNCTELTTLVIPKTVSEVGGSAFAGCGQAISIYYGGTPADWNKITITGGNGNLTKEANTFYYYSEQSPALSGAFDPELKYWHYVDNELTLWTTYSATLMSQGRVHSYVYGEKNSEVALPDLTSENEEGKRTFIGWYSDEDLTSAIDETDLKTPSVTLSEENTTYYAKWDTAKYSAIYVLNGGAIGESTDTTIVDEVGYGDVLENKTAAKENYMFSGWYSDRALETPYDFAVPVTGDVILYAKWENPHGVWQGNITWELEPSSGVLTLTGEGDMKITTYTNAREQYPWYTYQRVIKSIVIGEGITKISYHAFHGQTGGSYQSTAYQNVESITLPSTMQYLDSSCFRGLTNLKRVNSETEGVADLRNVALTQISAAFAYDSSLKCILLPESTQRIGDQTFGGCSSLVAVQIPIGAEFVGTNNSYNHFMACNSLKVIYLSGEGEWTQPGFTEASAGYKATKAFLNGGKLPDTISTDSLNTTLLTPSKVDQTFNGWYSSANPSVDDAAIENVPSSNNTSIYAVWRECSHSYTYTASENVITETCSNCDHVATATLSAPADLTYDGNEKKATITYSTDAGTWKGGSLTIEYYSGETKLNAAPTNVGSYTAKITVEGNSNVSVTVNFTIAKAGSTVSGNTVSGTYGDTIELTVQTGMQQSTYGLHAAALNTVEFTYQNGQYTVTLGTADVGSDGTATLEYNTTSDILPAGTCTVTATYSGSDNLNGNFATITVTISKADQEISFNDENVAKHINDKAFTNELTKTTVYGSISYTSSDEKVATVDASGKVTIVGAGETTITAAAAETDYYKEATASYTLTVTGHTEKIIPAVAATCTTTGLTEGKKCSVCSEILAAQELTPMIDHTWDDGVVTKEPTYSETGVKTYTCKICGATKTEEIAKLTRPSSGGSSGSSSSTYAVSVDSDRNGDVTVSPKNAKKGDTVTITVKPDKGYELDDLTVTDKNGDEIKVKSKGDNKYTFTMPAGKVEVEASFVKIKEASAHTFTDVPNGYWAGDAIAWASENGYMNGNTAVTFDPEGNVSRQQLWMILARLSGNSPASMAEAKSWAVDNGISDGTIPGGAVSRQQLVTILYRYAVRMGYKTSGSADLTVYPDHASVAAYAKDAMAWSVSNSIVGGTTQGTLDPNGTATRAQFAVILSRFCENIAK